MCVRAVCVRAVCLCIVRVLSLCAAQLLQVAHNVRMLSSCASLKAQVHSVVDTGLVYPAGSVDTDASACWEVAELAITPNLFDHALGEALDAHRAMGSQASRVATRADANIDPGPINPQP